MSRLCLIITAVCLVILPASAAPAGEAPEAILIGATVSQTGHFSAEVGPFERLMQTWAIMVNEQGGIEMKGYGKRLPVKLVIYDDTSGEATVKKYYERLATVDKVHLMVGPYSSPLTFAATTASENHKIPFVAVCANSPKIYSRGFKWLVGVIDLGSRYTYRYWEMVRAEQKAKTVSFVVEDTLHPRGVYEGSRKLAEEGGLTVLSGDIVPADAKDFTAVITKLKNLNPDIVYVSSNIPLAVAFMKQAKEMLLNPREYHCIHHSGIFRDALGEAADNVVGQSYWAEGMKLGDRQLIREILDRAKIAEPMYPWAPAYVAAFQVIRAALENAGTLDNETLMRTLKALSTETVLGPASFHESGYGTINTYPSQIQGSSYVVIWPAEVATGKHVYPRPPWK